MEVRNAFKDNVNGIPWMDNTTKMAVMEKVQLLNNTTTTNTLRFEVLL